ncbi:hypothetical protein HG263_01140 [Pseudoalteromonas sp. JBTF-M23]|uniref:Uncharacterized protein n=1 Tax=Pseudoalteromonas caenipelagi TaxID=2726988 RepID=A0A849VBH5_9GAMM|nr:hypothetical protein [Pseudoalteromonas caenipelagi]NOU49157.1 hypothetical protein [Pseudoalteromonas caenipelagi]
MDKRKRERLEKAHKSGVRFGLASRRTLLRYVFELEKVEISKKLAREIYIAVHRQATDAKPVESYKIRIKFFSVIFSGLLSKCISLLDQGTFKIDKDTIIGTLILKRIRRDYKAVQCLLLNILCSTLLGLFTSFTSSALGMGIGSLLFLIAIKASHKVLEYRIDKGFYGDNEYEAREILQFITSDGGNKFDKGKKIRAFQSASETHSLNRPVGVKA